jgi:hypothetical protein
MPDFTRGVVSNTTTVFMQTTLHHHDWNEHRCAILRFGGLFNIGTFSGCYIPLL